MTWWQLLKHAHVALAVLSAIGFCVRAAWMWAGSARLDARWVRIAPHVVDTFLLLSGVTLAFALHVSPGAQPWFAAKLVAIVVYIVLGSVALRRGRTRRARSIALAGSLASLCYVFAVAVTRNPLPGL
ncbi:MAG: SirB2 family protein [Gammaproteobacteria bacterium]|nr:SirB2 family protein [Gammaproteobacteria bacterium]